MEYFDPGLPRRIAVAPDGRQRPVPWSQGTLESGDTAWGVINENRIDDARAHGLCLVCGEKVQTGVVLWIVWNEEFGQVVLHEKKPPLITNRYFLGGDRLVDGGSLHDRCGKMTLAHCRTVRERVQNGQYVVVPYDRVYTFDNPCATV